MSEKPKTKTVELVRTDYQPTKREKEGDPERCQPRGDRRRAADSRQYSLDRPARNRRVKR